MGKRDYDMEAVTEWYRRGMHDMEKGRPFTPPDNKVHAKAYSTGWADEIMGDYTDSDELRLIILG